MSLCGFALIVQLCLLSFLIKKKELSIFLSNYDWTLLVGLISCDLKNCMTIGFTNFNICNHLLALTCPLWNVHPFFSHFSVSFCSVCDQHCEQNTLPAPSAINQQGTLDVVQKDSALWEAKAFKNTLSSSKRDQRRCVSGVSVSDVHSAESLSTPGVKDFLKYQLILQCQRRPLC